MLTDRLVAGKLEDIFPHLEQILKCGVFRYDTEKKESYWSPGIYEILAIDFDTRPITLFDFSKYIVESERATVINAVLNSREKGIPYSIEFSITDNKGNLKRIHSQNFIRSNSGKHYIYEGVFRDITENYKYKMDLEEKVQQLDKSNQNLQEFVYVASHDLQEPLRKISTFTGRLKAQFESNLGDEGKNYINRIFNSTNNMQVLLEDLLNFSRLSFSEIEKKEVSLDACLKAVLNDLEVKIEESHAVILLGKLPTVLGCESQLRQVFNNLLSNAIKFRTPGLAPKITVSGSIQIEPLKENFEGGGKKIAEIRVADNGIGFDPEFSEKIFKIFQRLNGKSEYPGSGLGLAICKKIIENHQGSIIAESTSGKGAEFIVRLPVKY